MINSPSPALPVSCDSSASSTIYRRVAPLAPSRSYLEAAQVGDVLAGRFQLIRIAGVGGMGQVFEAIDRSTGDRVAVKVMSEPRPTAVARFEREAKLLASFRDVDIVGHVAHGMVASGQQYLVMDWLEGEDLAHLLARRRLTVAETITLGARLGRALGVMHARGVVHRDVKPGNVFLMDKRVDQAKVLDLGLAKGDELADLTRVTQVGALVGTLGYIAPEQAQSDRVVDARADVFSLGCLLFRCLTGASPFAADRPILQLAKLLHEEAPRLSARCPEAPAKLEALIARMLAKNPDERPRDGSEVAEALQALADEALPSRPLRVRATFVAGQEPVRSPEAFLDTTLIEGRSLGAPRGLGAVRTPTPRTPVSERDLEVEADTVVRPFTPPAPTRLSERVRVRHRHQPHASLLTARGALRTLIPLTPITVREVASSPTRTWHPPPSLRASPSASSNDSARS